MPRQLADVDGDQVYKLARLGCTYEEIGEFFDVSEKTIRNRFSSEYDLGRSDGKLSLRRMQWKSARGGSVAMQIHLGKQRLGQSDKHDVTSLGASLFPARSQQFAVADQIVSELQCQIDERLGNSATPDASGLCDEGEPGPMADGSAPGDPESQTD